MNDFGACSELVQKTTTEHFWTEIYVLHFTDRCRIVWARKLAIYSYIDVAGYSRLTGDDEDATPPYNTQWIPEL
jgi:hypothetical protein